MSGIDRRGVDGADWRAISARAGEQWEPVAEALPGLLRIAASSAVRTAEWSLVTSVRNSRRVLAAASDPRSAVDLAHTIQDAVDRATDVAREVSECESLSDALVRVGSSLARHRVGPEVEEPDDPAVSGVLLRTRAEGLLDRSRDVRDHESVHPAYERIIDELLPDEARILVLFLREGPQPSIDVRTAGILGSTGSTLVAANVTMIGERAGVKVLEQVPSYLHNLARLGLVVFSEEQVPDPLDYQVLEAQPLPPTGTGGRRSRFVRRSIHLTPFGADFVRAAFVDPEENSQS